MILTKNIQEYCLEKKNELKLEIKKNFLKPLLAVIQVGENEASKRYIRNKKKDCEEVGIKFEWYYFKEKITTEELCMEIEGLIPFVDGIIVQMPLPPHIDTEKVKMAISPEVDVDGFHPMSKFKPCTPTGIIDYLINGCGYDFEGKHVTIIGRSDIVGKPLARMLIDKNATVTLCHSKTKLLSQYIYHTDLIVCAVGKANFLNCRSIHVPVIDVGINFDATTGRLVGDCCNTENRDVTPVPGGVGLLTRVALLENVIQAAKERKEKRIIRLTGN